MGAPERGRAEASRGTWVSGAGRGATDCEYPASSAGRQDFLFQGLLLTHHVPSGCDSSLGAQRERGKT